MSTYWWINISCIAVPFIASFHPKLQFYKKIASWLPAILITALAFVAWDHWYALMGVWGFNDLHIGSIRVGELPLEEIAFFICIPYACLFTYTTLKTLGILPKLGASLKKFVPIIGSVLIAIGLVNMTKWYTGPVFLASGGFLLLSRNTQWIGAYLVAYFILLIPFLISNGLLTGSWLEQEVVWYDDSQNLGLRLGTIPVEDLNYMNILLLSNVWLFEWFSTRAAITPK